MKHNKILKLASITLVVMVVMIISSMLFFLFLVQKNQNNLIILNKLERQRILSQKLTKTCYSIYQDSDSLKIIEYQDILKSDLQEFEQNNNFLLTNEISEEYSTKIIELQPYFKIINEKYIAFSENSYEKVFSETILEAEQEFFTKMDYIVYSLGNDNFQKIFNFKYFIIFSNLILIITIILLIYKIIRPAIIENNRYSDLIQKQNQELKNLVMVKDKFYSIISHDLKNPFNGIIGFSELIMSNAHKGYGEKIFKFAESINISAIQAYKLLENLLEWSMLHKNELKVKKELFILKQIVDEVINELKTISEKKQILIKNQINDEIILEADTNMLMCIFRNLITNSLKFTDLNGEVIISAVKNSAEIIISVEDNGIGMEKNILQNLFIANKIKSKKGTNNEHGTGLGLTLCKEFIEKHNGKIWVESEVNKGSKFNFSIPLK